MNIFISANNTENGKTYSTLKLLEAFHSKGFKTGVFKPIETGVQTAPADGSVLFQKAKELNPALRRLSLEDIVPIRHALPAAPFVSGGVEFKKIENSYKKIKSLCDVLLIEGAGGILVPVNKTFKMIDFVKFFNAKLFLVIGSRLGMINDFLLNRFYLQTQNINYTWAINLFDEENYFITSHPYMKQYNPLFIQKDLDKIIQKLIGA